MSFKLGSLFPKKPINEPYLQLSDPRWAELEGGYRGSSYDASPILSRLKNADTSENVKAIYQELWDELHHQGDVGLASYYAVPHMVSAAKSNQIIDYNVLGLVSLIEICRHKNNPPIPPQFYPAYADALNELSSLAISIINRDWDLNTASAALTAIAIAKKQIKLGNAIQNLDSDDVIEEFLENY
jgi:hypothetical protein